MWKTGKWIFGKKNGKEAAKTTKYGSRRFGIQFWQQSQLDIVENVELNIPGKFEGSNFLHQDVTAQKRYLSVLNRLKFGDLGSTTKSALDD